MIGVLPANAIILGACNKDDDQAKEPTEEKTERCYLKRVPEILQQEIQTKSFSRCKQMKRNNIQGANRCEKHLSYGLF